MVLKHRKPEDLTWMYRIRIRPNCISTEIFSPSPKLSGLPELGSVVAARHRFIEEPVKMKTGTTQTPLFLPFPGSQLPQQEISLTC